MHAGDVPVKVKVGPLEVCVLVILQQLAGNLEMTSYHLRLFVRRPSQTTPYHLRGRR